MNTELQTLQAEMNRLLHSLMSRGILTQQVYNTLCSEYAVKFTKLLATFGIKQTVSFKLSISSKLPTKASKLHNVHYRIISDGMFASRTMYPF